MAQKSITLDTLGDLDDGSARLIVNAAIREAIHDLDDRGDDGKPRKVLVELELLKADNGLVVAHVAAQAKMPPRKTAGTIAKVAIQNQQPGLLFQDMAPEDPSQRTIDEVDDR